MRKRLWIGHCLELHVQCDVNMMSTFCQGIGSDVLGGLEMIAAAKHKPAEDHSIFVQKQSTGWMIFKAWCGNCNKHGGRIG
jgi:hypothetical protein